MLTFARDLISTSVVGWRMRTPSEDAVANLLGQPQSLYRSGGPFWSLLMDEMLARGRDAILSLKQMKADLGNGETPILIRPCDCRQVPSASAGETVVATIGAAALRATTVQLTMVSGNRALRAGDQFSITHATWGERMYRLIDISGLANSPPTVRIRPPLREAVTGGTSVNFNTPGCVMRLDGEFQIDQRIPGRVLLGRAAFVEYERPIA